MIQIRLGNHHKFKENVIELIDGIKRHPGCCDEVWFASEYGYPPLEAHKEAAERIKELKKHFEDAGIKVSLQISNTIGHGEYMKSRDCSGLVYDGTNAEKMVDANGTVADYAFCWRGENFRKYTVEELKFYAEIKPDVFWIDDDLRAYNHAPVDFGCYCDNCIKKFNQQYRYSFTREELVNEMSYGDVKVREDYIAFLREGLADFTALMTKALIEISPESKMGFQSCRCNNYTGIDYDYIFEPMYKYSGKPPKYRPGGGFYNDKTPLYMLEKAMLLDCAIAVTPDYVEDIVPEVENTPDVAFGKSIGGTVKEATLYLALGCTSTSFASLMADYEDISWHENMFEEFSKVKPYWTKLAEISKTSKTCGVGIYESENTYKQKLSDGDNPNKWHRIYYMQGSDMQKVGVPITNVTDGAKVLLVTSAMVDYMDRDEIISLTKRPVITDCATIEKMMAKGVDFGIKINKLPAGNYKEILNSVGNKKWVESFFTSKGLPTYTIEGNNVKPIGTLYNNLTDEKIGCCNAIVELFSANWAVFGYSLWNNILSTNKRNQILWAVDEICGNTLPAYLQSGEQVVVIPKVNDQGKTVAVSLQSISIGKTQELTVVVRNPKTEDFYYMNGSIPKTKANAVKEGKDYIIKLPPLEPWDMITVFAE